MTAGDVMLLREGSGPMNAAPFVAGLFAIAVGCTLFFAAELLKPIALAFFFALLLSPIARRLLRVGVPMIVSAAVLVGLAAAAVGFLISMLAVPAEEWISEAPKTLRELKRQIESAESSFGEIQELAKEVDKLANPDDAEPDPQTPQPVVVKQPGIIASLVGGLPQAFAFTVSVTFLTYFFLAFGNPLLRQVVRCGRTWTVRRRILTVARDVQRATSQYLATVTVVNLALGISTAFAMHLLGVPNPLLWGAMVAIFNFAPYAGAVSSVAVLAVVGITTYENLAEAMTVPLAFLVLTTIEGQMITPTILGRRLSLSPVIVFLSVLVWGWLWGITGALMAVPILVSIVVFCDNLPSGRIVADVLRGGRHSGVYAKRRASPGRAGKSSVADHLSQLGSADRLQ